MFERDGEVAAVQQTMSGTHFGVSLGLAQVEVFASAAARDAVLEAERVARVAAHDLPPDATCRPTRLAEVLVTPDTDRAGVHAVLRDVAEAQAQLHALQAAAISRLAELQPAQQALPGARADDPADPDRPDDWVADEVAVVLGISIGSASVLVDKQRALFEQLPRVWAAAADGVVDVRRCQVLVDALAHRKRSAGGGLADDLVDDVAAQGLRWIGEGLGPTPLADRVGGAVIAADPAEAERRAERRRRRQNVTTVGAGDGLAGLRADLLDAGDAAAMQAVVDAMAAVMRRGGDRRPVGVLRVYALRQLLTRPWEALPEDVARARWQLRLRVDLSDLDDLGRLDPARWADDAERIGEASRGASSQHPDARPGADNEPAHGHGTGPDLGETPSRVVATGRRVSAGGGVRGAGAGAGAMVPGPARNGSGLGAIGGLPVSPGAVAELLARLDALLVTRPTGRVEGGEVWFELVDTTGRLRAVASPAEARRAARRGIGLGPPPEVEGYEPSAAQVRFLQARDRHCRFPGCSRPAEYTDLDHVVPRDHEDPTAGGPTCVTNLVCLCRRHHRLKSHSPGWVFAMDPDGTLRVTPPGGRTRTTRPAVLADAHVSAGAPRDTWTDLFGRTPKRFRTPTPDEREQRRASAAERADLAAEIDAELDAALERLAAGVAMDEPPPC